MFLCMAGFPSDVQSLDYHVTVFQGVTSCMLAGPAQRDLSPRHWCLCWDETGDPAATCLCAQGLSTACAVTQSLSPLQRVPAECVMILALNKTIWSGREPGAAIPGSGHSPGKIVFKSREMQVWGQKLSVREEGLGLGCHRNLIQPAAHFSPFRDYHPQCPSPGSLAAPGHFSCPTTLLRRGQFSDDTPTPISSCPPSVTGSLMCPWVSGQGQWPLVTGLGGYPWLSRPAGLRPLPTVFLGGTCESELGPFLDPQPPTTIFITNIC